MGNLAVQNSHLYVSNRSQRHRNTPTKSITHIFVSQRRLSQFLPTHPANFSNFTKARNKACGCSGKFRDPRNKTEVTPEAWKREVQTVTSFVLPHTAILYNSSSCEQMMHHMKRRQTSLQQAYIMFFTFSFSFFAFILSFLLSYFSFPFSSPSSSSSSTPFSSLYRLSASFFPFRLLYSTSITKFFFSFYSST